MNLSQIEMYKSSNHFLTLNQLKDKKFQAIAKEERFSDKNSSYWVKLTLDKEMKSGRYIVHYLGLDFDLNSFNPEQGLHRMIIGGLGHKLGFSYQQGRDSQAYFFHILPQETKGIPIFMRILSMEEFLLNTTDYFYYLLFCGIVMGIILMAGLYNIFMYYFNKERSFLYYALTQFTMVVVQFYYTGLVKIDANYLQNYESFTLLTMFFATLFTQAFFNTALYLKKWNIFLQFYLVLFSVALLMNIFLNIPILSNYKLYSILLFAYLVVGYFRLKEGFKPAKFFLFGWGILFICLVILEYFEENIPFNLILIGSPIEAIFLAIALAYKIELMREEKEQQKELLVHQSKLASMGEMIGNIAHQWRQPLNHLSYIMMNIQDAFKYKSLDEASLDKKVDEATMQLEFMSQTIDDFKDFYLPTKEKEEFSVEEETKAVLEIMKQTFKEKNITVELFVRSDIILYNYKNEYKQVLLNLLSNAKDVLVERGVASPFVSVIIMQSNTSNGIVMVSDNGGGIEDESIHKIFEPYFTRKEGSSGIGLYMSKMIIEKNMRGKLSVRNDDLGATFIVKFEK